MPFDIAKGTGTWKTVKYSDNYPQILMKLGVPAEAVDPILQIQYDVEMTVSGDTFTEKLTQFGQTSVNTFTLGVESEEADTQGGKRMVTYTLEGESMVNIYPNVDGKGLFYSSSRCFLDDNTIHTDLKVGDDLEGWWEAKRVSS